MIFILLFIGIISGGLILPGWWFVRKEQDIGVVFVGGAAVLFWWMLAVFGIGSQSITNLIELPLIFVLATAIAYFKMFVPFFKEHRFANTISYLAVLLMVFGFRLLMPNIPE